jgi:hypothetical protein
MSSLFYSNLLSSRLGKLLGLPSPSVFQQEKGAGQESNSAAVRRDIQMLFGLLPDFALFYVILAVDAALSAEVFLRGLVDAKEGTPAG